MGKRFGKSSYVGLGVNTNLILTSSTNETRTMIISEALYEKLKTYASRYFDGETFETILTNLLDDFDKHNPDLYWFNINKYNNNSSK